MGGAGALGEQGLLEQPGALLRGRTGVFQRFRSASGGVCRKIDPGVSGAADCRSQLQSRRQPAICYRRGDGGGRELPHLLHQLREDDGAAQRFGENLRRPSPGPEGGWGAVSGLPEGVPRHLQPGHPVRVQSHRLHPQLGFHGVCHRHYPAG